MAIDPRIQAALDAPLRGRPNLPKTKANRGYAFPPGTGPQGETCRTCRHSTPHDCSKRYWKCGLVNWTRGSATDIVLRSPACSGWEARDA